MVESHICINKKFSSASVQIPQLRQVIRRLQDKFVYRMMITILLLCVIVCFLAPSYPFRFDAGNRRVMHSRLGAMHFEEATIGNTALVNGALPRDRYIATNRFKVRNNAGIKYYNDLAIL